MFPVLTLFHLFTAEGVSADFRQEGESKIADVAWITAGHARAWGCRTLVFFLHLVDSHCPFLALGVIMQS